MKKYIRTLPSVMASMKEQSTGTTPSNVLHNKTIISTIYRPGYTPISLPKNMKQVRSMRFPPFHKSCFSRNALHNLNERAYDFQVRIEGFWV